MQPDSQYFTIYDSKVGAYRDPILQHNSLSMVREIELFFRKPQNQEDSLFVNAEDYQLFKIADFYKKSGSIVGHQPEHVANLHEIKSAVQRDIGLAQARRSTQSQAAEHSTGH